MQNYNAENIYRRWHGSLGLHLEETKVLLKGNSLFRCPDSACWADRLTLNPITKFTIYNFGRVVWGIFARAFWPIYMNGLNNHYGTIVVSFDPFFKNSPALFEVVEDLRRLREEPGEPKHLEKFARLIRNDWKASNRVVIPKELSGGRTAFFQSVYIPRNRLPGGYLHNRLVPVIAHPASSYACVIPFKFWPEGFRNKWLAGEPPLNADELSKYQEAFPNVQP